MAAIYQDRVKRAQAEMDTQGVDALVLGVGSDLVYFAGYRVHPSSRPTLLIVPRRGEAQLLVPVLEAPRVAALGIPFPVVTWTETMNPTRMTAQMLADAKAHVVAAGDELWARWLVRIQNEASGVQWVNGGNLVRELRMIKDVAEIDNMREASHRTDRAWMAFIDSVPLTGLTERGAIERLVPFLQEYGLDAHGGICASGPNSASPHHRTGDRVIQEGDTVVFDFGGMWNFYHSDITRTVHIGEPSDEYRKVYHIVLCANEATFAAVRPGIPCEDLDTVARDLITREGYGEYFIHRVGHGLGLDVHEEPYLVSGNTLPLRAGMVFSDEPGIYMPGKFGVRIEDAVVCTATGGEKLNEAPRDLRIVD
jgi:Xaa-Pro aminopeptidase